MSKFIAHLVTASAVLFTSAAPAAQSPMTEDVCVDQQQALQAISTEYKIKMQGITQEGNSIDSDSKKCADWVTLDCKMTRQDMIFDTPTATMRTQTWSLDLPQTKLTQKELKFDVPETRMAPTKTGQYPEFTAHGLSLTVSWHDIITDVPQVTMKTTTIVMGIPEVWVGRTSFKLDVPEFSMQRQRWSMDLPSCKVSGAGINSDCPKELQKRGQGLQSEANAVASGEKEDTAKAVAGLYSCLTADLETKRSAVVAQFSEGISTIDNSINAVRTSGGNPDKVIIGGAAVNLDAKRQEILDQRAKALSQIDAAMATLQKQQRDLTRQLVSGASNT